MARTRLLAVAAAATLALPAAADAAGIRAPLRVETAARTLVGDDNARVGAARAYLDSAGTPRSLPGNTALGQLVAGAAAAGVDLAVTFDESFGQGFVSAIGGRAGGSSGFWAFYVDNVAAATGADATFLRRASEYVWVLDPDFNRPGPFFLDLDVVERSRGVVTFRVTRAGGEQPAAARGATLHVNGVRVRVPASGRVTVKARGAWTARATLAGTIASETIRGTS